MISIPGWSQNIHRSACDGDIAQIDSLLQTVDINERSNTNSTPLHIAAFCGQVEVVHFLIEKGADVDARNTYEDVALHYAISARDSTIVRNLIDTGAELDVVNADNVTPVFQAIRFDNLMLTNMLVESGADVNLGKSPLHDAVLNNNIETLKLAINDDTNIDPTNEYENTPLAIAIRQGSDEIMEFLVSKGADIEKTEALEYNLKGPYAGQQVPDSVATVFAKGFISTENFVHTPAFNPDQTEIYYTLESTLAHGGTIMVTRLVDGTWTQPVPTDIEGNYREIDPFITNDGKKLLYSSNRPVDGNEDQNNIDLWMVNIDGERWSDPIHLGEKVNTEYPDWFPTLSDSDNLFFSTGPSSSSNIVFSQFRDGEYQEAVSLGDSVNSPSRDYDPLIAPDESYVIFSSNRPGGFGSVDLYVSYKKEDGAWTMAKNMGETVNTSIIEFAPKLSSDGKYLFFNRGADIYWVDAKIIEDMREKNTNK